MRFENLYLHYLWGPGTTNWDVKGRIIPRPATRLGLLAKVTRNPLRKMTPNPGKEPSLRKTAPIASYTTHHQWTKMKSSLRIWKDENEIWKSIFNECNWNFQGMNTIKALKRRHHEKKSKWNLLKRKEFFFLNSVFKIKS